MEIPSVKKGSAEERGFVSGGECFTGKKVWLPQNEEFSEGKADSSRQSAKTRRKPVGGIQQTALLMKLVSNKVI